MAFLTITCPRTGGRVSTGVELDRETFERLPESEAHLQCPHCGQIHTWRKTDAVLTEALPCRQGNPGK
jgi:predicted RNA-binding Zn-ribbon protein involved in translation (DUF1610 family)